MLTEVLISALGQKLDQVFSKVLGQSISHLLDEQALRRALAAAVARAEQRFVREYRARDPELADALTAQARLAELPSVQEALRDLLTRPFDDPGAPLATLQRSFDDVLPARIDRDRVDAAVAAFLRCLGQEVLYIPQLQHLYALSFQKTSAESGRSMAASAAMVAQGISDLRADLRLLPADPATPALPPGARPFDERPRPWHNLPQRSYTRFVGRQAELDRLARLMLPYPRSRHFLVTLDGIGGVGKSALALELAYRYRAGYEMLPPDERFEAIVWVSAKRTLLTAGGIQQRQQTFSTLNDLYREIATVLEAPAILQADPDQRRGLVERALAGRRTLLIVDNLETIDDEELLSFLRELPDPTKTIVTTRHRIDIAYTIRLVGMPQPDAQALMMVEAARKNVELPLEATEGLYRRTGGIPLAIVWSIGLMSLGHSVESVLRRLGSGHSDIARFCFAESVAQIRDRDAERLLLTLALFESSVSRHMLGEVAGLGGDEIGRDDALAELLQLSLVNQKGERFFLLPLAQSYARDELARQPELEQDLRERWIACLTALAQPYTGVRWRWRDRRLLLQEGKHLVAMADWCQRATRPDLLLPILPALIRYYDIRARWDEAFSIGQIGLEYARLMGDLQSIVSIEIFPLTWVLRGQGRQEEAEECITDALDIARRMEDVAWRCDALVEYSRVLRYRNAFDQARDACEQALQLVSQVSESQRVYVRANIEYELGRLARDRGDWPAAQTHFHTVRDLFVHDTSDQIFNLEFAWGVLRQLGVIAHQLGNLDDAVQMYRQSIDFCKATESHAHLPNLLVRLASIEEQRGNPAAALEYAREALEWSRRLGMTRDQAQAEAIVGRLNG